MAICIKRHPDNPENVYYVYWNDDRWVTNWNWLDNDWNGNYRVLRRQSSHSPVFAAGVSFYIDSSLRIHPPSMLPASFSFPANCEYWIVSIPFASHKIVMKYLR